MQLYSSVTVYCTTVVTELYTEHCDHEHASSDVVIDAVPVLGVVILETFVAYVLRLYSSVPVYSSVTTVAYALRTTETVTGTVYCITDVHMPDSSYVLSCAVYSSSYSSSDPEYICY